MPVLRLNEHYTSVQGEGPNVGKMTQFVRFSGCNMRCPGWPCDTQHAIQPALWKDDPKFDADMLIRKVQAEAASTGAMHICVTGGEPFLQDANYLGSFVRTLIGLGYTFDIFTNGSFAFPMWATFSEVQLIMDWKLGGSGEAATALDIRDENLHTLKGKDAVKFVIKDLADFSEARTIAASKLDSVYAEIYVGRVWDSPISDAGLVDLLKYYQLSWRLNIQVHKMIWPDQERGI